ncbi:MAG: hypothetical protein F6K10_26035 [Moorea sp. SIO2B7]|nr:hypothetical protein [Moorena sp. SIO2B7]
MEDWQKDFLNMLETVTVEFEQFFQDVGEVVESVADELGEVFETVVEEIENTVEEIENTIVTEIDQYLEIFFEPIVEIEPELEEIPNYNVTENDFSINPKVEATSTNHTACVGCRHFHGQVYGRNLLVCAMHPYGWDDENCPDWEGDNWD